MITQFELNYDFTKEYIAYTAEDSEVIAAGEKLKLYIPVLMNNIPQGDASVSILSTSGSSVFKNASGCKPTVTGSSLREKNYIEGTMLNNSSVDSIKMSRIDGTGSLYEEYVPKGSGVRCTFLNGKTSRLSFNTDVTTVPDNITDAKNENSRFDLQDVTLQINIV